jgi:hypothetical protein
MRCRRPLIPISVVAAATVSLLAAGCGSSGSPGSTIAATTAHNGTLAFVHCMRSHGVPNFPGPNSSGEIPKTEVLALNPSSPQFETAQTACQHLAPGGLGPQPTPQQTHAQFAAMLAFARCLRSHGFPNVPDPTSSGQLTPEMVAQAGINLHQPAVLEAADACVSVTHGLLTKADVARALNDANPAG